MPRKILTVLGSFALLLVLSADAQADPLVITGGIANISGPEFGSQAGSFNLLAAGFSATGGGAPRTGTTYSFIDGDLNSFFGNVSVNGAVLDGVFNGDTGLNFTLAPFTRPDPGTESDRVFVTTAFTMTGHLALAASSPTHPVLFTTDVAGSGLAEITYMRFGSTFFIFNIRYDFGAAEPVPEPATVLLLGTGLAGVAGAARRRRKARE